MDLVDKIYDCRGLASRMKNDVAIEVHEIKKQDKVVPVLAVIQVGEIGASNLYVGNKEKACKFTGIASLMYKLPEETTEDSVLDLIDTLNEDKNVHGILVQLPLPRHIREEVITSAITFTKDVDGFNPINVGLLSTGSAVLKPCTANGVMAILKDMNVDLDGKHAVVIGRSNIVGKPTAMMLTNENATVTLCHSRTTSLCEHTLEADIIVSAVGKAKFLTADMVKPGAIVVDVGINRDENGKMCGDVDLDFEMAERVSSCTPVPYGVGQMTVAMLMHNVVQAYKYQKDLYGR